MQKRVGRVISEVWKINLATSERLEECELIKHGTHAKYLEKNDENEEKECIKEEVREAKSDVKRQVARV